jgi:hypothetical protein
MITENAVRGFTELGLAFSRMHVATSEAAQAFERLAEASPRMTWWDELKACFINWWVAP